MTHRLPSCDDLQAEAQVLLRLDPVADGHLSDGEDRDHYSASRAGGGDVRHADTATSSLLAEPAIASGGRTSQASMDEIALRMLMNTPSSFKSLQQSQHQLHPNQNKSSRLAVQTADVCFKYKKSSPAWILNHVSLLIPEGTIYGLLGPSGCGKTSLLRCILNQLKPVSGSVSIFGSKPGSKGSSVPGPGVGYMPQEIALIPEFTILETISFFGHLNGMSRDSLAERSRFLLRFLDLPDGNRLIRELSGGQRRRVSLAAALVHSPPLLVLDEPTVGVDPLLRETIWEHLVRLTERENMTIIITTHYIEEARRANTVGFMRKGHLLVQDSPDTILMSFGISSLEMAFLHICSKDMDEVEKEQRKRSCLSVSSSGPRPSSRSDTLTAVATTAAAGGEGRSKTSDNHANNRIQLSCTVDQPQQQPSDQPPRTLEPKSSDPAKHQYLLSQQHKYKQSFRTQANIVRTLVMKGVIKMKRSIPELLFNIVNPAIQVVLFCIAIGQTPKHLSIAVFNGDDPALSPSPSPALEPGATNYSSLFLDQVDSESIDFSFYPTLQSAIESVRTSAAWAAIEIPFKYSFFMAQRIENLWDLSEETLNQSTIRIHADMTEYPIQVQLQKELLTAMVKFAKEIVNGSSLLGTMDTSKLLLPLVQTANPPVYGHFDPDFREFTTPGFILGIIYVVAVGLTAVSFVQERKEGILERSLVAGVRSIHILLAHVLIQFGIIFFQGLFLFLVIFQLFQISIDGSTILAYFLLILQGAAGMSLGFMVSSVCHEERPATMLSLALFYPNLILSGLVWPIEGMPYVLRLISYFLPQTMAIKSMRSIIARGLRITDWQVYIGFLSSIGWIIFYNMIALIMFASERSL